MASQQSSLPKALKGRPFRYSEAVTAGLTRHHLRTLLKQGVLEQISRGLYAEAENALLNDEQMFSSATIRVGTQSAICLLSSLAYYGLTDEIPNRIWIMVPFEKRSQFIDLKLFRTRNPHWDIGIESHSGFKITSLDRTIVDCMVYKSKIGSQIGIRALKTALHQKKTKIRNIAELARQLGIFHRVKGIIEAVG